MKIVRLSAVTGVVALLGLAAAGPAYAQTVIDFENVTPGTKGTSFSVSGVTFSGTNLVVGELAPPSGNLSICATSLNSCAAPLAVSFSQPVSSLSFNLIGVDASATILSALVTLSGGGTTLYTFTGLQHYPNRSPISFGTLSGITGLTLTNDDFYGVGYDDFSFQPARVTAAVPEPATWGLMLLGFGTLGFAMRRRAKVRTNVSFA